MMIEPIVKSSARGACVAALLSLSMATQAMGLSVSEDDRPGLTGVGDFGFSSDPYDVGFLHAGTNEVFGTIECDRNDLLFAGVFECKDTPNDFTDWFGFSLGSAQTLTSLTITATDLVGYPVSYFAGSARLREASTSVLLASTGLTLPVAPSSATFTLPLPGGSLGPGSYLFGVETSNVAAPGEVQDVHFDYKVTLEVEGPAPIPLPAGLPLLAAALGGIALLRRRG